MLSMNLATLRQQFDLPEAIAACVKQGISCIAPWRDQIEKTGLARAAQLIAEYGVQVSGLCRGGMFPASDRQAQQAVLDDNRRAVDEAVAIGADCLVLVVGGLPAGSRDLAGARSMVAEGIAALLPHARAGRMPLAIEPLHPIYAADRSCVNTLQQALDLCDMMGPGIGVAIDVYHVWWDATLDEQIARAGRRGQILAHHICDWLVPTRDLLLDRGMMGDGVIDLRAIRSAIETAGYHGPQEVEIFSAANWWRQPGDRVITTCIERFHSVC